MTSLTTLNFYPHKTTSPDDNYLSSPCIGEQLKIRLVYLRRAVESRYLAEEQNKQCEGKDLEKIFIEYKNILEVNLQEITANTKSRGLVMLMKTYIDWEEEGEASIATLMYTIFELERARRSLFPKLEPDYETPLWDGVKPLAYGFDKKREDLHHTLLIKIRGRLKGETTVKKMGTELLNRMLGDPDSIFNIMDKEF
jgi:hypothetical protein